MAPPQEFDTSYLTPGWDGEGVPISAPDSNGYTTPPFNDDQYSPGGAVDQRVTNFLDTTQPANAPDMASVTPDFSAGQSTPPLDTTPVPGRKDKIVPTFTPPFATPANQLQRAENAYAQAQFDAKNPQDTNHGFKGRLREIAENFLYSMGHAPQGSTALQALLLGGAGAGLGAINKTWNERRSAEAMLPQARADVDYQRGQEEWQNKQALIKAQTKDVLSKPDDRDAAVQQKRDQQIAITQRAITAYENRKKIHEQDADVRSGIAKLFTDANGLRWKQYLNADASGKHRDNEPVVNPTTGEQEFDPGEQMVLDPLTNTVVKAKQLVGPAAMVASSDAGRQQQANKDASEGAFRAQQDNVKAIADWHKTVSSMLVSAIGAEAGFDDKGIRSQIDAKNTELAELQNEPPSDSILDEKKNEERTKRINRLNDDVVKLNGDLLDAWAKTADGRVKAEALRKNLPPRPDKVTYTPYKAVQVGGGHKVAPSAQVDAFAQSKGWTRAQAEQYLKNNGWTIQ